MARGAPLRSCGEGLLLTVTVLCRAALLLEASEGRPTLRVFRCFPFCQQSGIAMGTQFWQESRSMKTSGKSLMRWLLILAVMALLVVGVEPFITEAIRKTQLFYRERFPSRGGEVATYAEIRTLVAVIETFFRENGCLPGQGSLRPDETLPSKAILSALTATNLEVALLLRNGADGVYKQGGEIVDFWHRPIHFRRQMTNGETYLMIWSEGCNGRDDNGRGDDVVGMTKALRFGMPQATER